MELRSKIACAGAYIRQVSVTAVTMHLSNCNSLETTCLHSQSHTAYNKDNMTCCELSHVPGEKSTYRVTW